MKRPIFTEADQRVTFVELFFDLVFVFAVTQLTGTVAEHLDAQGVTRGVLVFWLVWWAWTQFTWALNPVDTEHPGVRATVLLATGIAFVMAASVGDAFGEGGRWFGVTYVLVRLTGLGVYVAAGKGDSGGLLGAVLRFGAVSLAGLAAVVAGAFASPASRGWWWLGAVALDFVAAAVGGSAGVSARWRVRTGHFAERHGLFVIIALGESLIVAGIAATSGERTSDLAAVTGLAVAITCLLWWTYFGWLHPALEHRLAALGADRSAPIARDAFSILHFPLIGGVIGVAVAFEEAIAHPSDALHFEVTAALAAGVVLFLFSAAAALARAGGPLPVPRLVIAGSAAVALLVLGEPTPLTAFVLVAAGLGSIVATERRATFAGER